MTKTLVLSFLIASSVSSVGCQNGPVMGRLQQNQLENERLLSEFRSQQKEVEQLRADRSRLLQQQAETEKLAAKLQAQLNGRRDGSSGSNRIADRSNFSDPTRVAQDLKDRSFEPNSDRGSAKTSTDSLNWRPIRKPGL